MVFFELSYSYHPLNPLISACRNGLGKIFIQANVAPVKVIAIADFKAMLSYASAAHALGEYGCNLCLVVNMAATAAEQIAWLESVK